MFAMRRGLGSAGNGSGSSESSRSSSKASGSAGGGYGWSGAYKRKGDEVVDDQKEMSKDLKKLIQV